MISFDMWDRNAKTNTIYFADVVTTSRITTSYVYSAKELMLMG